MELFHDIESDTPSGRKLLIDKNILSIFTAKFIEVSLAFLSKLGIYISLYEGFFLS